ncbi:hypothetical protein LMU33_05055 [Streptomyces sp. JA03]|nr:hypothetical protein [Streptomyces barringtoniae]
MATARAERAGRHKDPEREPRHRRWATHTRPHGVRHLFAAYDDFSPHLTTKKGTQVGDWAAANNVEFAYTPTNSS